MRPCSCSLSLFVSARVWSFPELSKVHEFTTHEKEIDDVDFSPDGAKICSISKDR